MNIIYFDIETVPADKIHNDCLPVPKYGNVKDPAKREIIYEKFIETGCVKAMSVNPWLNQIVCIEMYISPNTQEGWHAPSCIGGLANYEEKDIITAFWQHIYNADLIVGFNILHFDLPTIINRSMALGIEHSWDIPLRRYQRMPVYDIAMILDNWPSNGIPNHSMDWWLKYFNLPNKSGDGSQIYGWYKENNHSAISNYCRDDVLGCKAIYEKICKYYPPKPEKFNNLTNLKKEEMKK